MEVVVILIGFHTNEITLRINSTEKHNTLSISGCIEIRGARFTPRDCHQRRADSKMLGSAVQLQSSLGI